MQGVALNAALAGQGRRVTKIQDLMRALCAQSRAESVVANLNKTGEFNIRSVRHPKRPSQNWGNIELFELGGVSTKMQCPSCAKYWPEGVLDCTCGKCLRPSKETQDEGRI